jgi:hypothetical protein
MCLSLWHRYISACLFYLIRFIGNFTIDPLPHDFYHGIRVSVDFSSSTQTFLKLFFRSEIRVSTMFQGCYRSEIRVDL